MKKLFVHSPMFRLLSPVFSGFLVYLLILLLNNNVEQLQEQFIGEELYFCFVLAYITQEFSRLLLLLFKRIPKLESSFWNLIMQIAISSILCVIVVTISTKFYFSYFIGYSPTIEELYTFNGIFVFITLIYVSLFISHQYLYRINTEKLQYEETIKQHIEHDFVEFKRGINPNLLFESFESLIVLMRKNKDEADDFIDHLATIYRYILSSRHQQLVSIDEEIMVLSELEKLFNKLPYRNVKLHNQLQSNCLLVPGTLLYILESIVRNTIISSDIVLDIVVQEDNDQLQVQYQYQDKLTSDFLTKELQEISRIINIYSDKAIEIVNQEVTRTITIPKLQTNTNHESSNHRR